MMVYIDSGFKTSLFIHECLSQQMGKYREVSLLKWMNKRKVSLIQKDPQKGAIFSNYRPITCLPIMTENKFDRRQF